MTNIEAIQAMQAGKKITHRYFASEEWMVMVNGIIHTEDGFYHAPAEFWKHRTDPMWDDGWDLFKGKTAVKRIKKHKGSPEYDLYKAVAIYLRLQYPNVMYHFDPTGLSLTKTQAGKLKAIQHSSGYPDLFIMEPRGGYHGLFIEIKPEGTKILKKDLTIKNDHLRDQEEYLMKLTEIGYKAWMGVGFDDIKRVIDDYLLTFDREKR